MAKQNTILDRQTMLEFKHGGNQRKCDLRDRDLK